MAAARPRLPENVERYRELAANQIAPHLGAIVLQELKASDIERWHATLRISGRKDGAGGLSALTIRHATGCCRRR